MKNVEKIDITLISNISFEPYLFSFVSEKFLESGMKNPDFHSIPYNEYLDSKYQKLIMNSELIVVWLSFEEMFSWVQYKNDYFNREMIDKIVIICKKLFIYISQISKAQVLWFLFEDYDINIPVVSGRIPAEDGFVDQVNTTLIKSIKRDNITFIDLKYLIAEVGIPSAFSLKGKYRWNTPYSKSLIEIAAKEIRKQYMIEKGITKKCIVLDCDNVLWGGILSEDGVENIKLSNNGFGKSYQDFQKFILWLYFHGVILAICSKNDLDDVMNMFHTHSAMLLKEEYISCFKVNWTSKSEI